MFKAMGQLKEGHNDAMREGLPGFEDERGCQHLRNTALQKREQEGTGYFLEISGGNSSCTSA